MAVPTLDELHRPVLEIAAGAEQRLTRQHFVQRLSELFSLTELDLQKWCLRVSRQGLKTVRTGP